mgnify:FL=1
MKKNKITQIVLIITLIITLSACNDDITDVKNLVTYNMYAGTYTKNRNNAHQVNFNAHNNGGFKKSYSYRPYASIVGLKQFYLSSGFYYTNWNNLEQGNVRLAIQK